jgi:hypothetical protein
MRLWIVLIVVALTWLASCRPASNQTPSSPKPPSAKPQMYVEDLKWGGTGTEPGKFLALSSVAYYEGQIYASDLGISRVQVFDENGKYDYSFGCGLPVAKYEKTQEELVKTIGEIEGSVPAEIMGAVKDHQFYKCNSLDVINDEVYIANEYISSLSGNATVVPSVDVYSIRGTFLRPFGKTKLVKPVSVSAGKTIITCADGFNNNLLVFDKDGSTKFTTNANSWTSASQPMQALADIQDPVARETKLKQMTGASSEEGKFDGIGGTWIFQDKILACDINNNRIQIFDADGNVVRVIQGPAAGEPGFHAPINVCVTPEGYILILDSSSTGVIAYNSDFTYRTTFGQSLFGQPVCVYPEGPGAILVADQKTNTIHRLKLNPEYK